jgi:hypothetical protein
MTTHDLSFECLLTRGEPGDLSWRHADNQEKERQGNNCGLTVNPTGCEVDWEGMAALLRTLPVKEYMIKKTKASAAD